MAKPKADPLQNLADAMVQDLMGMSDAELLAEATPEELAAAEETRRGVMALLDQWEKDAANEQKMFVTPKTPDPDPNLTGGGDG